MRLIYFREKATTPLRHRSKNMEKHMFQQKDLFLRRFLLKWELLKHLQKQKKIREKYTK